MQIKCEIKGIDKLDKKINNIMKKLPETIEQTVEDILKNIQGLSIRIERGHNKDGILVEMVENSTGKIKGRVYADPSKFMGNDDQSYLWFEYFGTGRIRRNGAYR